MTVTSNIYDQQKSIYKHLDHRAHSSKDKVSYYIEKLLLCQIEEQLDNQSILELQLIKQDKQRVDNSKAQAA